MKLLNIEHSTSTNFHLLICENRHCVHLLIYENTFDTSRNFHLLIYESNADAHLLIYEIHLLIYEICEPNHKTLKLS